MKRSSVPAPMLSIITGLLAFGAATAPNATICTYTPMATITMGARTAAVIAVDLNKDNILDIVATNQSDGTISVALGEGGGRFKRAISYPTSTVGPYQTAA